VWEPDPGTVEKAREGDIAAFELIVRGLLPEVLRLARHLVRDSHLAQDISQEVFLRAFNSLTGFKGDSRFSTWILRITHNASVDAIRRSSRQRRLAEEMTPAVGQDPSVKASLEAAVAALPADLRDAFVMIEIFGLSYDEASIVLSIPPGTLKSRMYRTRKLLIASLSDEETAGEM
jgi:RNA polymerase sigma-70 factor (ECF subfamily)